MFFGLDEPRLEFSDFCIEAVPGDIINPVEGGKLLAGITPIGGIMPLGPMGGMVPPVGIAPMGSTAPMGGIAP